MSNELIKGFDMKELKDCPFCGNKPELLEIGNEYTKSRKITIKCPNCRIERTNAAIRQDMEWLKEVSIKNWNKRITKG